MIRRSFFRTLVSLTATTLATRYMPSLGSTWHWQPWVDPIYTRYSIGEPFVIGNRLYATDGRKMITFPTLVANGSIGDRKVPPFNKLPWDLFDNGGWKNLDFQNLESIRLSNSDCDNSVCPYCHGIGRIGTDVQWMLKDVRTDPYLKAQAFREFLEDGEFFLLETKRGTFEQMVQEVHDVWGQSSWHKDFLAKDDKYFNQHVWWGGSLCVSCHGTGWIDDTLLYLVDGYRFEFSYLELLKEHGSIEYKLDEEASYITKYPNDPKSAVMLFRNSDGCKGFICGRNQR